MNHILTFEIPLKLPGLNEYTARNRNNRYGAAAFKKKTEEDIMWYLPPVQIKEPITLKFTWHENGSHPRDLDNIAFAKKFILDAMQKKGIIENDDSDHIKGFRDEFVIEKGIDYKVEVEIYAADGIRQRNQV